MSTRISRKKVEGHDLKSWSLVPKSPQLRVRPKADDRCAFAMGLVTQRLLPRTRNNDTCISKVTTKKESATVTGERNPLLL